MATTNWNTNQSTDPFAAVGGGAYVNGSWYPKYHPLAQQAGAQGATPGPGAPAPGGATSPTGPTFPTTAAQAVQNPTTAGQQIQSGQPTNVAGAFQQALVNRLAPGPLNANDPAIKPAITANRLAEQRGFERNRAQLANRAAAMGIDPQGFTTQLTGLAQDRAGREATFEGNAVMQQAAQRAQDITNALSLGGSMLSQQDQFALQRELAQLDAQLRREGLSTQSALGQGDLALRGELGRGQLDLGLLNALISNQQFGQGLSADLGKFNANLNQQALLALLG